MRPFIEQLESRDLPSAVQPAFVLFSHNGGGAGAKPFGSPGPTGLTPTQIRHAYGFDQITFNNGTVTGDGTGTTIAIVDAYDDPNIASDLHQFDQTFGLSDPTFTKVNQNGGSTLPQANTGWAEEISLDVEWAHAIAPGANILLVEATSPTYANLFTAVTYAAAQSGVVAVSMSWGGSEFFGQTGYDSVFKTPSGHAGVTFVSSSGDSGAPVSYPASSPNVLAVGGTTLNVDSSGNIQSESGWSGSGGGLSAVESQPSYQSGVVTQSSTARANPDVAYDADPNTGFPVYITYGNSPLTPWLQFGGTSAGAPQWAALIAIADQGRGLAGLGSLDGATQTLPKLYSLTSDFNDITTGTSTGSPHYSAGTGYDLVTGLGTPIANKLVADLVGSSTTPSATHFSVSTQASATAGAPLAVTVTALDASGNPFAGYTGTVHFTSSDPAAVLPSNYQFVAGDNGTHTFTVTLTTAGTRTIAATDTVKSSVTGTASVTVSPAAAATLVFGQQPTNATAGATITPAVTVRVLDAYGNLVTTDNTDQITLALASNPGAGTLSGTTTVTVSGGFATFGNLSINNAGNGYTLQATSGSLAAATSASFNINAVTINPPTNVIEGFETSDTWNVTGFGDVNAYLASYAAHDGFYGLDMYNGSDWIYRSDAAAQVQAVESVVCRI
jgi:subtilase family serine protease